MAKKIDPSWAVFVYKPCTYCSMGGRIQRMDGISNAVVKCPECGGKGHHGKQAVRLRDLHRYLPDSKPSGGEG